VYRLGSMSAVRSKMRKIKNLMTTARRSSKGELEGERKLKVAWGGIKFSLKRYYIPTEEVSG